MRVRDIRPNTLAKFFKTIRGNLVLLILIVFGHALSLNLYFIWALKQSGQSKALVEAMKVSKLIIEQINQEVEGIHQLLMTLGKISRIRIPQSGGCNHLLRNLMLEMRNSYKNLIVMDKKGRVLCQGTDFGLKNYAPKDSNILKHISQFNSFTSSRYRNQAKIQGMLFAYPLHDFKGEIRGAVAAVLEKAWFVETKPGQKITLPEGGDVAMLDKKGHIYLRQSGKKVVLPPQKELASIIQKGQGHFEAVGKDQKKRIFVIAPLAYSEDIFICVSLLSDILYSTTNKIFITTLAILLLSGILVLSSAWLIATRRIVHPLSALVTTTRLLAEGRYDKRQSLKLSDGSEIAHLSHAFDRMAVSLENREKALEKSYKRLANILNITYEAIISLDHTFTIQFFNPAAEKIFGYEASEVLSHTVDFLLPENLRDPMRESLSQLSVSEKNVMKLENEMYGLTKAGYAFPAEIKLSCLHLNHEILFTIVVKDITEKKRTEEVQARWSAELARSNAELEQFAYNASHDLQEPLRMVASYTQLLQTHYADKLDERAKTFIQHSVDGAARLQKMIQDLLAYARAGRGGILVHRFNCEKLVKQVISDLRGLIEKQQASIEIEELPTIIGNETAFRQVVQNLLSNALKFTGINKPEVKIGCIEKHDHWIFFVKDNGIGIDPEFSKRVFGLFQRVHVNKGYAGTGIGLALCRKIVENYGGRIWFEKNTPQGTIFHFTLPKEDSRVLKMVS